MKPSSKACDSQGFSRGPHAPASALKRTLYYRLPLLAFCLLLFWQSAFPSLVSVPLFPHDDKLMHLMAYAFLAFLAARNIQAERPFFSRRTLGALAILFALLYGLSDEIHQAFVPGRTASVWDLAADTLGGVIGTGFYLHFFYGKKTRPLSPTPRLP